MTMVGLPLILFQVEDDDLSDLKYLRDFEVTGDLVNATGLTTLVGPAVVTSITPAIGKTFFIAAADSSISNTVATNQVAVHLRNDTTVKSQYTGNIINDETKYVPFVIRSDSLVGDGIKTYNILKSSGVVSLIVNGTIQGWVE